MIDIHAKFQNTITARLTSALLIALPLTDSLLSYDDITEAQSWHYNPTGRLPNYATIHAAPPARRENTVPATAATPHPGDSESGQRSPVTRSRPGAGRLRAARTRAAPGRAPATEARYPPVLERSACDWETRGGRDRRVMGRG